MNKKVIIIVSSVVIIILGVILFSLYVINHNEQAINDELELTSQKLKSTLDYIQKSNLGESGIININAKYKGAHGEHYPRESIYNYEATYVDDEYQVTYEGTDGYIEKNYQNSLLKIYHNIKNSKYSSKDIDIEDDTFLTDFINDILDEEYNSCKILVNTEGLIEKVVSTEIICDDLFITFKDKNTLIKYNDNKISIDTSETGYALNINDKLRMNAFLEEDKNKYSVVIDGEVFYIETYDNKLHVNASSAKAIYNAMEFTVEYQPVEIKKNKVIEEIEVPIIRYFNEYEFNYWRD